MTAVEATQVEEKEIATVFRVARDRSLVATAAQVLESLEKNDTIFLEASGVAIGKCISLAESLKRQVKLWQVTKTGSKEQESTYKKSEKSAEENEDEEKEDGKEDAPKKLKVSTLHITLSKCENAISKAEPGYQAPVEYTEEEKKMGDLSAEDAELKARKGKGKGKGKGGKKEGKSGKEEKKETDGEKKEDGEKTAKKGKGGRKGRGKGAKRGRKSSAEKTEKTVDTKADAMVSDAMAKQVAA